MSEGWERIRKLIKMVRKLNMKDKVKVLGLVSLEIRKLKNNLIMVFF